jgi:hypothetical protein
VRNAHCTLVVLALGAATAACGHEAAAPGSAARSAPAGRSEGQAPQRLVGRYGMTLDRSDLPSKPDPILRHGLHGWTLKISNTGGVDHGTAFTLVDDGLDKLHPGQGTLESPRFEVVGDRILLHQEECAPAPAPIEAEYRWKLTGDTLRLTAVRIGCTDKVALTLLTSHAWTRRP